MTDDRVSPTFTHYRDGTPRDGMEEREHCRQLKINHEADREAQRMSQERQHAQSAAIVEYVNRYHMRVVKDHIERRIIFNISHDVVITTIITQGQFPVVLSKNLNFSGGEAFQRPKITSGPFSKMSFLDDDEFFTTVRECVLFGIPRSPLINANAIIDHHGFGY